MKKAILVAVVLVIGLGAYFAGVKMNPKKNAETKLVPLQTASEIEGMPEGEPSIFGRMISVDGSEISLAKFSGNVFRANQETQQEREQRRSQFESMSEADREAMRAQRQRQMPEQEAEKVSVSVSSETVIMKIS
ncbi:MAG TPA: hypothetical protein DD454_01730, partial [Candidatus Moranbacteria bacterium]|nr:hypothetical protein [Candidatus Moranbacteria bacterium]